jgi:hypothetical protein
MNSLEAFNNILFYFQNQLKRYFVDFRLLDSVFRPIASSGTKLCNVI